MARRAVSGLLPQYAKNASGSSAADYWLKFYFAGTSVPITIYTDVEDGTALAKCTLNTRGEPLSNPVDDESVFIPYVNSDYDAYLFFTADDADDNNTAAAQYLGRNKFLPYDEQVQADIDQVLEDSAQGNITAFDSGETYTLSTEWVEEGGVVYRPKPSALPIGPGAFDSNDWVVAQIDGVFAVSSVAALVAGEYTKDQIYVRSYYDGWAATTAGPQGGFLCHKTGGTNSSPTVGTAVSAGSIGGGDGTGSTTGQVSQAGYFWDSAGDEWAIDTDHATPLKFGAKINGVYDDGIAVRDAASFADGAGLTEIYLEGRDYTFISNGAEIPAGISVIGGSANIDATAIADSSIVLKSAGASSVSTTLSSDVGENENSITVTSATGFAVGGWIQIQSDLDNSWSGFRTYRKQGFFKIEAISGTTITLSNFTRTSFESASSTVYVMPENTVRFSDITMSVKSTGDTEGLSIQRGVNCTVSNVKVVGCENVAIGCSNSVGTTFENCNTTLTATAVDTQYGIAVSSSQDTVIKKCNLTATRHAVAIVGSHQTINTVVHDCRLRADLRAADAHGNTDKLLYERCTIDGGITFGGKDVTYKNCEIKMPTTASPTSGIGVLSTDIARGVFEIIDCTYTYLGTSITSGWSPIDIGRGNVAISSDSTGDVTIRLRGLKFQIPNMTSTNFVRMGNGSSYKVNFDVTDVDLDSPNCLEFVRYEGAASDADFVIIENIRGSFANGLTLLKRGTGATGYDTSKMKMPRYSETVGLSYSSGAASATFTSTFRYAYPRTPNVSYSYVGAKNPSGISGREIYSSITAQSASAATVTIQTMNGSTFGAAASPDVNFSVSLSDL